MRLSDIHLSKAAAAPVTATDVARAEAELGLRFPVGYGEFITALGAGCLSHALRVYSPQRVQRELEDWRARIRQYWFWDAGADVLTKAEALQSVVFADTLAGDEFIFSPASPDRILVLPRYSENVFCAGRDLWEMIEWTFDSGELFEPVDEYSFEGFGP